ncbi:hypothetical protein ACFXPY_48800 [Streptomyces sp. NPDC059153]|uniref:hypothetical protein n=1 Tax=unclassified Streptomyces TaxID=2593676 RepID=UPI0036B6A2FF
MGGLEPLLPVGRKSGRSEMSVKVTVVAFNRATPPGTVTPIFDLSVGRQPVAPNP